MSAEIKDKMHVRFDDNVANDPTSNLKSKKDDANSEIHYTRDDLLGLRNNLIASQPPKFMDAINDFNIDEKKRNRLRRIMKMNLNNNNNNNNNVNEINNKNSINLNAIKRSSNVDRKWQISLSYRLADEPHLPFISHHNFNFFFSLSFVYRKILSQWIRKCSNRFCAQQKSSR